MNSRERVLAALHHIEPDRVPIDLFSTGGGLVDDTNFRLLRHLGISSAVEPYRRGTTANYYDERLLEYFDVDFRHVWLPSTDSKSPPKPPGVDLVDRWGVGYRKTKAFIAAVFHPLADATVEELDRYPWPDPPAATSLRRLTARGRHLHEEGRYAIMARDAFSGGMLDFCLFLRGPQRFFSTW